VQSDSAVVGYNSGISRRSLRKLVYVRKHLLFISTTLLLHPFNGLFSRTAWITRHQKGKPFWILLEQEMMAWQWHQLDHMQIICTSLQTDSHTVPHHSVFTGRMPFLPPNQQHWSTIVT